MTFNEKKVIVEYLRAGEDVSRILMADLAENDYPREIYDILNGVFEAIMQVDEINKFKLNNDANEIMKEIECNYLFEEKQDLELIADELRKISDEDECMANRIFEIGINAILEEFYKKYVGIEGEPSHERNR